MESSLVTVLEVEYPIELGQIGLRGEGGPLSWERSFAPARVEGNKRVFEIEIEEGTLLELKLVREERDFSRGRNVIVFAGESLTLKPHFEEEQGTLDPVPQEIASPELERSFYYRVYLPPSYAEHSERRYPVLYVQDGHAAFSGNEENTISGSWNLDQTLDALVDLGAIEEVIAIGVHTDFDRIEILSPTRDAEYGGGGGERYLEFLTETLKPQIDAMYRTKSGPHDTAMLGSSMGGLFSFYAAWTRPDIFGKVACLSGSFWWDHREMVRVAQRNCPVPRPLLYVDSGAAIDPFEEDANVVDGLHHTFALRDALFSHCYEQGASLHLLTFPGLVHDEASWGARVAIPLQLLFPKRG